MAWIGITVLGLALEISLIIALGLGVTRRSELRGRAVRDVVGPRYGPVAPEATEREPAVPRPRLPAQDSLLAAEGSRPPTPVTRPSPRWADTGPG